MEKLGYLFAIYTIVWAVLFGYVWVLLLRQKQIRKELESIKALLREKK